MSRSAPRLALLCLLGIPALCSAGASIAWNKLPRLPSGFSVAGACLGVSDDALLVAAAGGASTTRVFVLAQPDGAWLEAHVSVPVHSGATSVSFGDEVICIGGRVVTGASADVSALRWNGSTLSTRRLPPLPQPLVESAAAVVGSIVFVAGGATGNADPSASARVYRMDLAATRPEWQRIQDLPGGPRTAAMAVSQHDGRSQKLYVIGGRSASPSPQGHLLEDTWQLDPARNSWRSFHDAPRALEVGSAIAVGQSNVLIVPSMSTGEAWTYHAITDAWTSARAERSPSIGAVGIQSAAWRGRAVILAVDTQTSGTLQPWFVDLVPPARAFGSVNFTVVICYLLSIIGIGVYCAFRNKTTDDYFRGGQNIPWWAAACSIYATMLSSLTYVGLPALVFATDWVLLPAQFMILAVAPIVVYIAMPFFRRMDATSAYEYLGERFNMPVRLIGSALFVVFHLSRMAIVMALAALALAALTQVDPVRCVLIMGALCLVYATLGGIEAVIWTDTIQTVVLIGGAMLCVLFLASGVDGGIHGMLASGSAHGKLTVFDMDFGSQSYTRLAFWVIVIGGIGQQLSVYVGDQAVVQRYLTTRNERDTARSIWMNGILAGCASVLFFLIGTGLFAFYRAHPGRMDPTIQNDQVFPMFIGAELPAGVAGLVVAGIFAAAKSTVATTMNSIAATVISDFLRPFGLLKDDHAALRAARAFTVLVGIVGTAAGLIFISPRIRSLSEEYFKVIGMFMGVLGGLFLLGMLSRRATARGALAGLLAAGVVLIAVARYTQTNGFLYASIGIVACVVFGYLLSAVLGGHRQEPSGART